MMEIESRIAGIPCIIKRVSYERVKGCERADSRDDYYGWMEAVYEVYDRRGRIAPWLECKATDQDWQRVDREFDAAREYIND